MVNEDGSNIIFPLLPRLCIGKSAHVKPASGVSHEILMVRPRPGERRDPVAPRATRARAHNKSPSVAVINWSWLWHRSSRPRDSLSSVLVWPVGVSHRPGKLAQAPAPPRATLVRVE